MRSLMQSIGILLLINWLNGQDCKNPLNLIVTNSESNTRIEDFELEIRPTNSFSNFVDSDALLCDQEYEVTVIATNFHIKSTLWTQKSKEDTLRVALNPLLFSENKTHVLKIIKQQEAIAKVERVETNKVPANSTLGDALSSIKGVEVLKTGQNIGKPVIHGMHSSRVPTFVNGIRIEDQEWGVEHDPNVDITDFEQISVVKGAGMMRYAGNGIGGIALLESDRLKFQNDWEGKSGFDYLGNGSGFGGHFSLGKGYNNKFAFWVHGAYNQIGDQSAPNYVLSNTGAKSFSGSIKAGYKNRSNQLLFDYSYLNREMGILRAAHTGSLSDLLRAIEADEPFFQRDFSYNINAPKQEIGHHLAKINWKSSFGNFWAYSLAYAYQRNQRLEFDIRRSTDKASLNLTLQTHDFLADFDFHKWKKVHIQNGIALQYQNNFANPDTGVRRLIPDYDRYKAGVYNNLIFNFSKKLKIETALRYDYTLMDALKFYDISRWKANGYDEKYPEFEREVFASQSQILTNPVFHYHNGSGVFGLDYTPSKQYHLLFNYGVSVRSPNPSELFSDGLHHSAASIERGDLSLTNETAHKINLYLTADFDKKKELHFELAPYLYRFSNYIYNIPTGAEQTIRGSFPVWSFMQIDALISGIDLDFGFKPIKKLDYDMQISTLYGQDLSNDKALINMPPLRWEQTLQYSLNQSKKTHFGFSTEYVAKQNRYPDFNFNITLIENGMLVNKEVDLSTPPPAYFLLHANFSHQWKWKENDLEIRFVAHNLLDESYRNYLNRLRYFADEIGRTFNLKINYKF